jgi:hypothetical protein
MVRCRSWVTSKPQISPLRYAPVEMTKGRAVMVRCRGWVTSKPQISALQRQTISRGASFRWRFLRRRVRNSFGCSP